MNINGKEETYDLKSLSPGRYHIIKDHQSYELELVESDLTAKKFIIRVNDKLVEIIGEYKTLLNIRNDQVLGNSSSLYSLVDSNITVKTGLKAFFKQVLLYSMIAIVFALMFAVAIALFRKTSEQNV